LHARIVTAEAKMVMDRYELRRRGVDERAVDINAANQAASDGCAGVLVFVVIARGPVTLANLRAPRCST
jgi:hypothetical protein